MSNINVRQGQARQALAELEFARQLEEVRAESGTAWGSWKPRETARSVLGVPTNQRYAATFRHLGIDIDTLPVDESAKRITALGGKTAVVLPTLDDWVAVRSIVADEAETDRLIEVLRIADADPWRQQVRDALGRKDWAALEDLAKSPDRSAAGGHEFALKTSSTSAPAAAPRNRPFATSKSLHAGRI